jgi:hypothetical protein
MKSCKDWLRENIQFEVKRNPQEPQKHGEDSTSPTYPTAYPSPIVSYRGRKQFPFLWNSNNIRLIINLRSNKLREEKKQEKNTSLINWDLLVPSVFKRVDASLWGGKKTRIISNMIREKKEKRKWYWLVEEMESVVQQIVDGVQGFVDEKLGVQI